MEGEGWGSLVQRTRLLFGSSLTLELRPTGGGSRSRRLEPEPTAGTTSFFGPTSLGRDEVVSPVLEVAAAQKVPSMTASAGLTENQTVPESQFSVNHPSLPSSHRAQEPGRQEPGPEPLETNLSAAAQGTCAILAGVPAIGCDVIPACGAKAGRSSERSSREQAAGRRAHGRQRSE